MNHQKKNTRVTAFTVFLILVFFGFAVNLFRLQVTNKETENKAVSSITVDVAPARGEIIDRNGLDLVVNHQGTNIIFDYSFFPPANRFSERIKIIDSLIRLFEKAKVEWIDELPLVFDKKGNLSFKKNSEATIAYLKSESYLNLNAYATAQNCFDALIERYHLENYDKFTARKIASVCFNMIRMDFSASFPYTFAENVTDELVAKIKENNTFYVGVDVDISPVRTYYDGTIAPHILGLVGVINAEEYEQNKDKGYGYNDKIGKNGIEYAMEDILRGTAGERTIYTDSEGNKTSEITKAPHAGNTVQLTLDRGLQKTAQNALEEEIKLLQKDSEYTVAGSVTAVDVNSGEVLACATAPSFNAATYFKDADKLNKDKSAPLWNRALNSTYTPGSTIKIAVAMGALEEKIIDVETRIPCYGVYTHYKDYQPTCLGYHGGMDVVDAIYNSCNIFFYETARLMGITALNKYFNVFGLGTKTGVELGEAEGLIDSAAYRDSMGELWTPGLTLQAGIGHGANLFTPIQICNYAAMIATRGTRYQLHFVKNILNYDRTTVLSQTKIERQANVKFKKENWDLVQQGMYNVANKGKADFSSVRVTVAAKTGTTTMTKYINGKLVELNNGLIIAYAPYEKPEIAICVAMENIAGGSLSAGVAAKVLDYYFSEYYGTGELPKK